MMDNCYKKIKELRIKLGLSQDELGKMVGYAGRSTINHIESGRIDLSISKLKLIARALHTTPAYLMGWETEEEKE